jgi:hypothetical protein
MASTDRKQHYLALKLGSREPKDWEQHVASLLSRHCSAQGGRLFKPTKTMRLMLATPSGLEPAFETTEIEPEERICSVALHEHESMRIRDELQDASGPVRQIGIDLRLHRTDYWNPAEAMQPLFGNTDAAHRLMAVPESDETFGVNVVIIDQGVSRSLVDNFRGVFGGGWEVPEGPIPGTTKAGHGSMLARNILQVAPGATIFDLPIIPADITNLRAFLSDAHAAFSEMLANIEGLRETGDARWQRPWVLVNAWAAFNLGNEHGRGEPGAANHPLNYSANREHPLNIIIGQAASKHDVVFAAGNCGQFCPSRRCGVNDVGPSRSIIGANSHPDVLTVGAVRTDGLWLGYSSQGPGALCPEKPDVCAPSQFSDNDDAYAGNTGTSAACALAAGVVARLRSKWDGKTFSPGELKRILTDTAFGRVEHSHWDGQLGHGIINYTEAARQAGVRARTAVTWTFL